MPSFGAVPNSRNNTFVNHDFPVALLSDKIYASRQLSFRPGKEPAARGYSVDPASAPLTKDTQDQLRYQLYVAFALGRRAGHGYFPGNLILLNAAVILEKCDLQRCRAWVDCQYSKCLGNRCC